jgi:hypothetical protein
MQNGVNVGLGAESHSNSNIMNQVIITQNPDKGLEVSYPKDVLPEEPKPPAPVFKTRDLVTAKQLENECLSTIPPANVIECLTLIIDMLYSNPFKVSDYIIVELKSLQRLIQLLTSADDVMVQTTNDVECGCCGAGKADTYSMVNSIQVRHDDVVREFKYTYQEAAMFLKDRHISIKFVFA